MADAKAPVAIRVSRPYASEEALLEGEVDALSKSGIVLLGVASRPEGTTVRFELTLQDGTSVMRAEGRVTGQKTVNGEQGLALKFTRLDSKSKAFVDRATAVREARAHQKPTSSKDLPPPAPSDPSLNDAPAPPEPIPPAPAAPEPVEAPAAERVQAPVEAQAEPSPERATALERLRARAKKLTPEQIAGLLETGRNRGRSAHG